MLSLHLFVQSTIWRNFYADGCLISLPNEDEATVLIQDVRAVCATCGFRLSKWTSNNNSSRGEGQRHWGALTNFMFKEPCCTLMGCSRDELKSHSWILFPGQIACLFGNISCEWQDDSKHMLQIEQWQYVNGSSVWTDGWLVQNSFHYYGLAFWRNKWTYLVMTKK